MKELVWAAVGGFAVYWWIKHSCPCTKKTAATSASSGSTAPTEHGDLALSPNAPTVNDGFAPSNFTAGCSGCDGTKPTADAGSAPAAELVL